MTASMGHEAKLEVSEDGDTFIEVKGISDLSVSRSWEEHDRTTYDGIGKKDYDLGLEDCTLTLSAYYDEDDAGQLLLAEYADARQALYYRYTTRRYGTRMIGRILVTSIDIGSGPDDASTFDVTLRCLPLDYGEPSLDLPFAETLSLRDTATETYPVTFTRATNATYVGADGLIKTAAVNEARFDHDPTTGESLGLLIEEQRTNLVSRSEGLDFWNRDGGQTSISTGHTAPDGSTNAWLLNKYGAGTSVGISWQIFPTSSTNVNSWFLKAGTATETIVSVYDATTGSSKWAVYSWAGGVPSVSSVTSEAEAFDPVYYGNGWWRVSVKVLNLNSANPNFSYLYTAGLGTTTGTVYAWGAQIEAGAFPTSYIPTAGAAVTRNTDEALIVDANFYPWHGGSTPTEGTVITDATTYVDDPARVISLFEIFGDYGGANRWFLRKDVTGVGYYNAAGGVFIDANGVGIPNPGKTYSAFSGSLMIFGSGATYAISTWGSPTVGIVKFGQEFNNLASVCLNGHYKRFTFYRSRLPNLHLQTLTEP